MHEYWNCVAPFGRFVDISRVEVGCNGRLEMKPLARHASFMSFDLEIIADEKPKIIAEYVITPN